MQDRYAHKLSQAVFIGAVLWLAACTSLVRPGFTQAPSALQTGEYLLDPSHATVLFKINHMGFSQYIGRFNKLQASLDYNADNMSATRLHAIVDTASIDVNDASFSQELAGADWFDSEQFPQAVLTIDSFEALDGSDSVFSGTLQMHGKKVPIQLSVHFNGGAKNRISGKYTIGFSGTATIKRSDFGITKYIGIIGDMVELEMHAEFLRQ